MYRSIASFFILFFIVVIVGCGPRGLRVEYVEGIVTLDGAPVTEATVTFLPTKETPPMEMATSVTDANGVYKLSSVTGKAAAGAVAGEYRVMVTKSTPDAGEVEYGAVRPLVKYTHHLPAAYRDPQNSPLIVTVKKGKNNIPLELKTTP
ncbi:MAG: hypothetical protein FWD31_15345 [Planctomycetaceae bacterium]|nr:hypothetical protein [Planctomycetaceae bacterium]